MSFKFLLIAFAMTIAIFSCTEKEEPASEPDRVLSSIDTVITLTAADTLREDYKVDLPFDDSDDSHIDVAPMSDTAAARHTPDFTDMGVGMLLQQAASVDPTLITSCIIPRFTSFFESTDPDQICAGPYYGDFSAPDPLATEPLAEQCSTGVMLRWNTTGNQLVRWHGASSTIRASFIGYLSEYQVAVTTLGYFPVIIEGLQFGSTVCSPYTNVLRTKIYYPDGRTNYWRIRLNPPF